MKSDSKNSMQQKEESKTKTDSAECEADEDPIRSHVLRNLRTRKLMECKFSAVLVLGRFHKQEMQKIPVHQNEQEKGIKTTNRCLFV